MSESIDVTAERLLAALSKDRRGLLDRLTSAYTLGELNVQHTLSNSELMLGTLAEFARGDAAPFLPAVISTHIRKHLAELEPSVNAVTQPDVTVTPEQASALLDQLDRLYAYCLQYGLISFGFTSKIAARQVEEIAAERSNIKQLAKNARASLAAREAGIDSRANELNDIITQKADALLEQLAEQIAAGKESSSTLDQIRQEIEGIKKQAEAALTEVSSKQLQVGKIAEQAIAELDSATTRRNQIDDVANDAAQRFATISAQLATHAATAGASATAVTELQAKVKLTEGEIRSFFDDIEKYRGSFAAAKKEADTHYNTLKDESSLLLESTKERTEKIVSQNEAIQKEIQEHLRKAVGVSLFSAFDTRRKGLTKASWAWAVLLFVSVAGTIGYGLWFVGHLKEITESNQQPSLIFARLAIFAPLAFLVAFTAKRYTTERRAEEEYAFKSAISVSLDSFRELIARMKQSNQDTSLVEKLVLEIFDNPTRRLYATKASSKSDGEADGPDITGLIEKALDKIPNAK
jgi:hypothetical protein